MARNDDGADYPEVLPVERETDYGQDPGLRMLIPIGLSGWAIAAGYLGLVSVLIVPAPLALITGILALREMRRNPRKHGKGRAIFGIVMGGLGTLGLLAIAVLAVGATMRR